MAIFAEGDIVLAKALAKGVLHIAEDTETPLIFSEVHTATTTEVEPGNGTKNLVSVDFAPVGLVFIEQ